MPATVGGFAAKIVEFSLTGCRIEHADRMAPHAHMPLRFTWRGAQVRIEATIIRSEMMFVGGKPGYLSGLEFSDPPMVVHEIVAWLASKSGAATQAGGAPPPSATGSPMSAPVEGGGVAPAVDDEPEVLSAEFVQCTLTNGKWSKVYVGEPAQPRDGFTIATPSNESEVDVLCRAYEKADAAKRKTMRASFELAIARNRR